MQKNGSLKAYLGCILDETMSGEPMAYKTIKKIISRFNYLFKKSTFWHHVSGGFYATHWFSRILIMRALRGILILGKYWKIKFKVLGINVFNFFSILMRWLIYRKMSSIFQCVISINFKFVNDIGPNYLNEVFQWATESNRTLRNGYRKLNTHFAKQLLVKTDFLF